MEELSDREIRHLGQEAMVALNNAGLQYVMKTISDDAVDELIKADPTDFKAVAIAQGRVLIVDEIASRLETMAKRAYAMAQAEETVTRSDLN